MSADRIKIETRPLGDSTEVYGYVDGKEVLCLSNHRTRGDWVVDVCRGLPFKAADAAVYIECMSRVLARAKEHGLEV